MKNKIKASVLAFELILGVVIFGVMMCMVNSYVGYNEFKKELETMYSNITQQLAKTGASYIDSDKIPYWLENGPDEDWEATYEMLDDLTKTAELAYIYVTTVNPDYKIRTYIFDTVNPLVVTSEVIPFGKVSSLENKEKSYIDNLREVLEEEKGISWFVYKDDDGGHVTTAVPLYYSNGKTAAIIGIVKPMYEIKEYKQNFLHSTILYAVIFSAAFLILYTIILFFHTIRPILFITQETHHFAEHHGELSGILKKIKNHDELGTLAKAVEKMSLDLTRYIEDLTHTTAEKERLSAELNVATQIQAEMLPRVFPPYKNHKEIELFASMEPAKEVGGDFYDFYMIDDDHFAVVVGDVSGKGVPAALFMVITKTLLKDTAMHSVNPAEIFSYVNNLLCEGNESGLFVTCWLGILTLSTGELVFANAGHNPPVFFHNNEFTYLKTKPNLMLAGMEQTPYTDHTITLQPGDGLFIYTDGITEATDSKNELYGEERLLNVMQKTKGLSCREVLEVVRKDIDTFDAGAQQFDDITMLQMLYRGREKTDNDFSGDGGKSLKLPAEDKNLQAVNDFIHAKLPSDCDMKTLNEIDVAVEEIFVNIAHYAYGEGGGFAEVLCDFDAPVLRIEFIDSGIAFNPLERSEPDLTLSADEREIGGLGIFLTKKFMDSVEYNYTNGQNHLIMTKTIS